MADDHCVLKGYRIHCGLCPEGFSSSLVYFSLLADPSGNTLQSF